MKFKILIEDYERTTVLMYCSATSHCYIAYYTDVSDEDGMEFKEITNWGYVPL